MVHSHVSSTNKQHRNAWKSSSLAAYDIEAHWNVGVPIGWVDADTPGVHGARQGADNNCVCVAVSCKYLLTKIKQYQIKQLLLLPYRW